LLMESSSPDAFVTATSPGELVTRGTVLTGEASAARGLSVLEQALARTSVRAANEPAKRAREMCSIVGEAEGDGAARKLTPPPRSGRAEA
jgi:hypothetical protein